MLLVVAMDGCVVVVLVAGGDATMVRHMATDGATHGDRWRDDGDRPTGTASRPPAPAR